MSKVWRIVFVLVLFAKHKLRVFPHLIPRPLLLPWEEKGSYEQSGFRSAHKPKKFLFSLRLCFLA